MNSFDKVIGYKSIKRELLQICDMIRNRTIYEKMGARLPHGLLLYGDPGLGKSLLANCFMEECGLNTVTVRHSGSYPHWQICPCRQEGGQRVLLPLLLQTPARCY